MFYENIGKGRLKKEWMVIYGRELKKNQTVTGEKWIR